MTGREKESVLAAMERLRWAQSSLDEVKAGGASLQFGKTHVHNTLEILRELYAN